MNLAIETSSEPASIAIQDSDDQIISRHFANNNQVNVPLADELVHLLSERSEKIDTILVGAGPGSYSGARVGLATAEALAIVHNCPIATLPSVYGVAHNKPFTLIGDARRGAYFISSVAKPTPEILNQDDFKTSIEATDVQLVSFEPATKLPLVEGAQEKVLQVFSSAEQLLQHWSNLSETEQQEWKTKPNEVTYLRPPHITKAKSPF